MDNNNTNKPTGSDSGSGSVSDEFFVKPPAINLPKGGGAIRGVDEKFQVNPSNGSAAQSIPIFVSPGRGFAPQLAINYDSGSFGFGWSLALPSITRKTNNLPRYHESSEKVSYVLGNPSNALDLIVPFVRRGLMGGPDILKAFTSSSKCLPLLG